MNITDAKTGHSAKNRVKYIQFSAPNSFRNAVLMTTTVNTPKAYREWSVLISRWGVSEGIAAITGLSRTSDKPAETEKITVPATSPM